MTTILGISCFYHDAAAAIVRDGEIIAAAQEERFTRKKHERPNHAIHFCLEEAFVETERDRCGGVLRQPGALLRSRDQESAQRRPARRSAVAEGGAVVPRDQARSDAARCRSRHPPPHLPRGLGVLPVPLRGGGDPTIDGVGEWATTSIAHGDGERLRTLAEIHYPHSIGLLYSAFTYFCGFKVNSGEYKLMGLAPYGRPIYADAIRSI